jgi:copper chaperone CopZ
MKHLHGMHLLFAAIFVGILPSLSALYASSDVATFFANIQCNGYYGSVQMCPQSGQCPRPNCWTFGYISAYPTRGLNFRQIAAAVCVEKNKISIQTRNMLPHSFGKRSLLRLNGGSLFENSEPNTPKTGLSTLESTTSSLQKSKNRTLNLIWLRIFSGVLAFCTLAAMFHVIKNASAGNMFATGISAGLASSSCCIFQMSLNGLSALGLLNVGCAGFNITLGPWRTFFRFITAGWLLILWFMGLRNEWPKLQLAVTSIMAILLSCLPEMITALSQRSFSAQQVEGREVVMNIEGMGCEACQVHVQNTIEAATGVIAANVAFSTGAATVRVAEGSAFDAGELISRLEKRGYRTSIVD